MRRPTLCLFLVALLAAPAATLAESPASAEPSASLFLEDLTSPELADAIRAGKTTIIVPIGGTEQNGPHMVLGKHNVRAQGAGRQDRASARQRAGRAGRRLRARGRRQSADGAHALSGNDHRARTRLREVLESAARSFRLHGFRDIVLPRRPRRLPEETDGAWPTDSIANGRAPPVRVHAIVEYYRAASDGFRQALKSRGYSDDEIGTHAGLADTSLALAIDPGLVRRDKLAVQPITRARRRRVGRSAPRHRRARQAGRRRDRRRSRSMRSGARRSGAESRRALQTLRSPDPCELQESL